MPDSPPHVLDEYRSLRDEITHTAALVSKVHLWVLTGTCAIVGFGVEAQSPIICILPLLLVLAGLRLVSSYLDATLRIATYLRVFHEEPCQAAPTALAGNWETALDLFRRRTESGRVSEYLVGMSLIYVLVGLMCGLVAWSMLVAAPHDPSASTWPAPATWVLVVISTLGTIFLWHEVRAMSTRWSRQRVEFYQDLWRQVHARLSAPRHPQA